MNGNYIWKGVNKIMTNCKCGKELLEGEKKCERCRYKGKETRNKFFGIATAIVGVAGVGIKKYGPKIIKTILKK